MENENEFPAQAAKSFDIILVASLRDSLQGTKSQPSHVMHQERLKVECSELDFPGMWFFSEKYFTVLNTKIK